MIKKLSILIGMQILSLNWLQAQSKKDFQQAQFENSLQLPASFLFADSVVKKYNILERMSYYNIPSVSMAVIDNGKVAWAKAYGYSNDSLKIPANTNTMYQAASISKSVNAICIIKLVQDGKLSLTMDIRQYLKSWKFPDNGFSKGKDITLSNLLSHTAGLGTSGFMGYPPNSRLPNTDQMLDGMAPANSEAVKPVIAPNTKWLYSGGGTLITKKILNDNISADYAALLMQQVLKPLKMKNSTFEQPLPARYKDYAIAYNNEKKPIPGGYNVYPEQAPDGLWTTPADYAQFILSVQRSLAGKKNLLSKAMAEVMLKPVLAGSNAALGVNVKEAGGEKYFFHSGTNIGYQSIYYGSFTTGKGVVILTNSNNSLILDEIVNSVASTYNWKDFYKPEIRKLIVLSDSLANNYAGDFKSNSPALNIKIRRKNGGLQLTTKGESRFEKMYFTSDSDFFLSSSPNNKCRFFKVSDNDGYTLQVKQGEQILFSAKKQ